MISLTEPTVLVLASLLRIILLVYGEIQDRILLIPYTDIDYSVFTSAATFLFDNQSPYLSETFRYTPLLAYINIPNLYFYPFAKIVFCLFDLLSGYVILQLLKKRSPNYILYSCIWLLNPYTAVISTRGSCESILSFLVLSSVWAIETDHVFIGSIMYGLSVHFKIVPIIYAIPIWFNINHSNAPLSISSFFTKKRIMFGIVSALTFLALGGLFYGIYGNDFLNATYLYHIGRQDHRHNFSIYFYHFYLESTSELGMKSLLFIPQLGSVVWLGYSNSKNLCFALFLQTFAFVMFNKVITSQYFIWYLTFLPMVLAESNLTKQFKLIGSVMIFLWILSQCVWLYLAYQLEFKGLNTFFPLFTASVFFFLVNLFILLQFIKHNLTDFKSKKE